MKYIPTFYEFIKEQKINEMNRNTVADAVNKAKEKYGAIKAKKKYPNIFSEEDKVIYKTFKTKVTRWGGVNDYKDYMHYEIKNRTLTSFFGGGFPTKLIYDRKNPGIAYASGNGYENMGSGNDDFTKSEGFIKEWEKTFGYLIEGIKAVYSDIKNNYFKEMQCTEQEFIDIVHELFKKNNNKDNVQSMRQATLDFRKLR